MSKDNILKISELRKKNQEDLVSELVKHKKKSFELRFALKSGELQKTDEILKVRRNIAKIKTAINEIK